MAVRSLQDGFEQKAWEKIVDAVDDALPGFRIGYIVLIDAGGMAHSFNLLGPQELLKYIEEYMIPNLQNAIKN